MAKVTVCDLCKADGKLVLTTTYMAVKGRKDLRLDYCKGCKDRIPKGLVEYTIFVYRLGGIELSLEEATKMTRR